MQGSHALSLGFSNLGNDPSDSYNLCIIFIHIFVYNITPSSTVVILYFEVQLELRLFLIKKNYSPKKHRYIFVAWPAWELGGQLGYSDVGLPPTT